MSSHFDQEIFSQTALQPQLQGQAKVMMEKEVCAGNHSLQLHLSQVELGLTTGLYYNLEDPKDIVAP